MYHKVKSYIEEHHMINHGDVVLAGVSGGGDSMAMLDMLRKYSQEVPFSLCAVHVHHGIRGEEADRRRMWQMQWHFLPQNKAAISPGRCSVQTAAWQCKRRKLSWKNAES